MTELNSENLQPVESWQILHTDEEMAIGRLIIGGMWEKDKPSGQDSLCSDNRAGLTVLYRQVGILDTLPRLYEEGNMNAYCQGSTLLAANEEANPDFLRRSLLAIAACRALAGRAGMLHNSLVVTTQAEREVCLQPLMGEVKAQNTEELFAMLQDTVREQGSLTWALDGLFAVMNENALRARTFSLMVDTYMNVRCKPELAVDGLKLRGASLEMFDTTIPLERRSHRLTQAIREVAKTNSHPELQTRAERSLEQSEDLITLCKSAVIVRAARVQLEQAKQRERIQSREAECIELFSAYAMTGKELRNSRYMPLFSAVVSLGSPVFAGERMDKASARWLVESVHAVAGIAEKGSNIEECRLALRHKLQAEKSCLDAYWAEWVGMPASEARAAKINATDSLASRVAWLRQNWEAITQLLHGHTPEIVPHLDRMATIIGAGVPQDKNGSTLQK